MESIINSVTELCKYNIVNLVNTGNKVNDNLIVALLLSLYAIFSANILAYVNFIYAKILGCFYKNSDRECQGIIKYPELICKPDTVKNPFTWRIGFQRNSDIELICKWIFKKYPNANFGSIRDCSLSELSYKAIQTYDSRVWRSFNHFPFFKINKDIIYAHCASDDYFYLYFNIVETYKIFIEQLEIPVSVSSVSDAKPVKILNIIDPMDKDAVRATINVNKNFDTLVFKQKDILLKKYDTFIKNNLSPNVFLSKNLGILLYGEWGTGKTSIIRATCIHFGRPAAMFDFKQNRKAKSFISAVNRLYKTHVLVFDELDFLLKSLNIASDGKFIEDRPMKKQMFNLSTLETQIKECKDEEFAKELQQTYLKTLNSSNKDPDIEIETLLTVMDGLNGYEDRLVIGCTNNPENIPSSLLRSGRFDLKIYLSRYDQEQYVELLSKIFDNEVKNQQTLQWLQEQKFPAKRWAPADIIPIAQDCGDLKSTVEYLQTNTPILKFTIPLKVVFDSDSDSDSSFLKIAC